MLHTLRLGKNALSRWSSLGSVPADLPSLHTLVLSDNPLTDVLYPPASEEDTGAVTNDGSGVVAERNEGEEARLERKEDSSTPFKQLHSLHLSDTNLREWRSVSALGRFPSLRCVQFEKVPPSPRRLAPSLLLVTWLLIAIR